MNFLKFLTMKILSHASIVFGFVGLLFFSMSQVNYLDRFSLLIEQSQLEEKLGELTLQTFDLQNENVNNQEAIALVEMIKTELCLANQIPPESIQIYLYENEDVNAFAIPNRQIIVYSGLIDFCENHQEIAAVLAHEMAHIEHNHVMKKLGKEIGLAAIAMMIGGNAGVEAIGNITKVLSSTAYDRAYEKEADKTAVNYLQNTNIHPNYFKHFMLRLSENQPEFLESMYWISTHPDSKDRAKWIDSYSTNKDYTFLNTKMDSLWILIKSTESPE